MAVDNTIGARSYIEVIETLRDELLRENKVRTVTVGDITEIDLDKQTIFPLAHIIVNNVSFEPQIATYNISLLIMDIIHEDTTTNEPIVYQNDNENYILNSMLHIGNYITDKLSMGSLYDGNKFIERGSVSAEPFKDRFENELAGWAFTFDITLRNNIDRCN